MNKKIIFTKVADHVSDIYYPQPAYKVLPDWYKKTKPYIGDTNKKELTDNLNVAESIKKCIPVFDILTAGYIIFTHCDIWVKKNEIGQIGYITHQKDEVQFHPVIQAAYHPKMNQHPYPKIISPWSIKTPKGYSCLFLPPPHGGNDYLSILEGFVDTDKWPTPVNFPFVLKDKDFEGIIPAGTPIAQIIPIKRDKWKMQNNGENIMSEINEHAKILNSLFYNRYKKIFWSRKEYK
jgi:hypothetical protein